MYLLLDLGNTRLKAVAYDGKSFTALQFQTLSDLLKRPFRAAYLSSVGNEQGTRELLGALEQANLPYIVLQSEATAFGLKNSYQQPQKLGVDRWLAMLGAHLIYPDQDLLVVDAGTAVTLDWIRGGQHQGGWIIPGLRLQQQALLMHTARVNKDQQLQPDLTAGHSTNVCVENGALAAIVGAIRCGWQISPANRLLLTGGDALLLKRYLVDLPVYLEPDLIFLGIAQYINN
ncbi:MAG: type III pantothenate kinase [Alishewanella sp. 34-51-39]|nr:MAG: type III pantothenate kinase [Alishewanella sp. 34-51-39]